MSCICRDVQEPSVQRPSGSTNHRVCVVWGKVASRSSDAAHMARVWICCWTMKNFLLLGRCRCEALRAMSTLLLHTHSHWSVCTAGRARDLGEMLNQFRRGMHLGAKLLSTRKRKILQLQIFYGGMHIGQPSSRGPRIAWYV